MWAEKKGDKEELSEVKARAVACLELGADTQPLLLCASRALWENLGIRVTLKTMWPEG